MKKEKQFANLWDLTPKRNAEWETTEEGKVVVLVPKFRNPFLVKWLLPYLSKPFFRIKLDDVGSAIWQQLDGGTPVSVSRSWMKRRSSNCLRVSIACGLPVADERPGIRQGLLRGLIRNKA